MARRSSEDDIATSSAFNHVFEYARDAADWYAFKKGSFPQPYGVEDVAIEAASLTSICVRLPAWIEAASSLLKPNPPATEDLIEGPQISRLIGTAVGGVDVPRSPLGESLLVQGLSPQNVRKPIGYLADKLVVQATFYSISRIHQRRPRVKASGEGKRPRQRLRPPVPIDTFASFLIDQRERDAFKRTDFRLDLDRILSCLSDFERALVVAFFIDDRTYKQIQKDGLVVPYVPHIVFPKLHQSRQGIESARNKMAAYLSN